jgi:hypothetical protein
LSGGGGVSVTIEVSDSAALATAIAGAHDGDTILLSPGEYVLDKVQGLTFAQGVTITSADPMHRAILDGLYLQDDSGLTFRNLEVKIDPVQRVGAIVLGGDHITLDGLSIHGAAVGDGLGVRLLETREVMLSNLDIHNVQGGVVLARSDDVTVLNSSIHDLEIDAIQSAGSSHVTISGNSFTNFYPQAGDHSDVIQFVGTPASAHDIVITNNTYVRGLGPGNTQGIFMGDEGGAAYRDVTISGNMIVGAVFHGISVYGVDHLNVSHNTVEGYADVTSWILVNDSTNSSVTDNSATAFNPGVGNVGLATTGNTVIPQAAIGDASILGVAAPPPSLPSLGPPPLGPPPLPDMTPETPMVVTFFTSSDLF